MTTSTDRYRYVANVPVLDTSQPNFKGAAWRVTAAGKRLSELQLLLPRLAEEWTGYMTVRAPRADPDNLQVGMSEMNWNQLPAARELTVLASEVLHHARSALDFCAYQVVWLDSGTPRDGTQFPLVTDQDRWEATHLRRVPGISDVHLGWIEDVQPFAGVAWSSHLVALSNRDKHRVPADVIPVYRCRLDIETPWGDPLGDPTFRGYAIDEPSIDPYIAPDSSRHEEVEGMLRLEDTLFEILSGVVDLANKFLTETGWSPIQLSVAD